MYPLCTKIIVESCGSRSREKNQLHNEFGISKVRGYDKKNKCNIED